MGTYFFRLDPVLKSKTVKITMILFASVLAGVLKLVMVLKLCTCTVKESFWLSFHD